MKKDKKMYFFHNVHTKYYPLSWVKYKSSQTINKWTTPDTALWQLQMLLCFWAAHLLHGEPYTFFGSSASDQICSSEKAGGRGLYIYLFVYLFWPWPNKARQKSDYVICFPIHTHEWM